MIADTDSDDPRLAELLLRWEDLHDEGRSVPADELCSSCPELAGELARRIALLRKMDPLLVATNTASGDPAPATPAGGSSRESATARADFRDLRFHAAGALGEVFMARNAELNREVALKFLKPERTRDPASLRRFLQEAEVTGRLEHPGVVPIYALGTDGSGAPCYAMRFIRGATLQVAIDAFHAAEKPGRDPSERSLAWRELLNRFVSICNTVAYAHSRGILHRDLKPRNVMLGKYDETLVVDWGLAKPFGRDEAARSVGEETLTPGSGSGDSGSDTPTVGAVGTPAYMSPEQGEARWDIVGPASDLFSLGGILYAILTGQAPYQGRKVGAILEKVKRCEFPTPRQVKPGVPRALEAICLKAMAMKPTDRYAAALDLAADVRRWLADEPMTAYAEPFSVRARRWMRRRRTAVSAAAAAVLAGLIGLAGIAAVTLRANDRLTSANAATTKAKEEAEAALAQSEEARKRAQAVLAFLKDDVLATARPEGQEGGLGTDVSVRTAVGAAEPKIAGAFQDQPVVEAEVRDTLGLTYYYLGDAPLAIRQHERAVELRRTKLGPDHPDTLTSRNNLAAAYLAAGRTAEAITLDEATLKLRETKLGPGHPATLTSRHNLAETYRAAGRTAEAVALHEATLKLCESKLGPNHPDTLTSRSSLASAYWSAGRTAEAVALDEETLKLCESKFGPDHPATLTSRNNLAETYRAAGRTAEAVALHEATLKLCESKLGPDHPHTLRSRSNLAVAYVAAGRWAAAEPLRRDLLDRRRRATPPDSPVLADDLAGLGFNLLMQAKRPEAETVLRECLAIHEKVIPDVWSRFNTMSQLGGALLGQGRYAEAEPLVIEGYKGMKAREVKMPPTAKPRLPEAADRVVRMYEGWGQPEKAAEWKARLGLADLPADVFAAP